MTAGGKTAVFPPIFPKEDIYMTAVFKKYIGTKAFYKAALAVAVPIMIQNVKRLKS